MVRDYQEGVKGDVKFFIGNEVEHTVTQGKKTLFVSGVPSIEDIMEQLQYKIVCKDIKHIYFGANQSFNIKKWDEFREWEEVINHFIILDYLCTLDFDVKLIDIVTESLLVEHRRFIPMISVKIPFARHLGYNATIKIDDSDYNHSNPGVWCHQLHDLMSKDKFTCWDEYTSDTIIGEHNK
jgi:hypothetical protein